MHTKHNFQPQFAYKIPKIIRITISKVKKSEICYQKKKKNSCDNVWKRLFSKASLFRCTDTRVRCVLSAFSHIKIHSIPFCGGCCCWSLEKLPARNLNIDVMNLCESSKNAKYFPYKLLRFVYAHTQPSIHLMAALSR